MSDKNIVTKDGFVEVYKAHLEEQLGTTVSKDKAWALFKGTMNVCFAQAASSDGLSLAGVGKFRTATSGRTDKDGKHHKKMKFSASTKINGMLDANESFT